MDPERPAQILTGGALLQGDLALPPSARGIVLFAHGSGSSRHSPRNRFVAEQLRAGGLATLLCDLLTLDEEAADAATGHLRFDVALLGERLVDILAWLSRDPETRDLRFGLFGASTGAAAALFAAAARSDLVGAVVSRGGRPDLAGTSLPLVRAPTLFIVGGADPVVLELNRAAYQRLECERALEIVPAASHLFEEPGALEQVAARAREWFLRHIG